MRVYFRDRAERDRLAQELNAEEVLTTGGYLTVIRDRDLYYGLTARGLRVEIDENSSRNLSDSQLLIETFYSGYKSVEEIYAFLDQKVAQFPDLFEKVDIGDNFGGSGCSWPPTASNQFGVDNNRHFPFHWGCCNGSSGLVCDQTYRGTSAGSDPETMAIVNKIRTLVPDQRGPGDTDPAPITATGVYQNIHTNAAVNLYTWGWTNTQMPNYAETNNIAAHMAAPNAGGNGYPYGSIIQQLYPVDGGSIDW